MTPAEIDAILSAHRRYLKGDPSGKQAYLTRADLRGADLTGANLTWANLTWANLTGANLTGADLTRANLTGADLTGADLTGADLAGADLAGADLREANLTGADLTGQTILPEEGEFTGFKKLESGAIATLRLDGKRVGGLIGRKCRAERATVLAISDGQPAQGFHGRGLVYVVGETYTISDFDDDVRIECAPGIHFFLTRAEAERYNG